MEALDTSLEEWLEHIVFLHQEHQPRGLYRLFPIIRTLSLTRVASLSIVVGGTNGKGTTVHYLDCLLRAAGFTVGATYSPHLIHFNERIQLNNKPVSDELIINAFEIVEQARGDTILTFHEFVTLAAMVIFKQHQVQCAIFEVGLGGRLDATNVTEYDAQVITNIGLDHQDRLGLDRESISFEKAGILQTNTPLIYGDRQPARAVLARAKALQCPMFVLGQNMDHNNRQNHWNYWISDKTTRRDVESHLLQPHFPESLVLALTVVQVLKISVKQPLSTLVSSFDLPGRCELLSYEGRKWIIDVTHNADGVRFLRRYLEYRYCGLLKCALIGMVQGKDHLEMLEALDLPNKRIVVTDTEGFRGMAAASLILSEKFLGINRTPDLGAAIQLVLAQTLVNELIVVLGSFDLARRFRLLVHRVQQP